MLYGTTVYAWDLDASSLRSLADEIEIAQKVGLTIKSNVLDGDMLTVKMGGDSQEQEDRFIQLASERGIVVDGEDWTEDQSLDIY